MHAVGKRILDKESLVIALGNVLEEVLGETREIPCEPKYGFYTKKAPSITVGNYLKRISKYAHCSESAYVLALIYIDRIQERNQDFILNDLCVHRLIVVSIVVAAKFFDDFYYKNEYYAKVAGIPRDELNMLEVEFIQMIGFDLFTSPELFWAYHDRLQGYLVLRSEMKME